MHKRSLLSVAFQLNLTDNLSNSIDYAKKLFSDAGRLIILIVLNIIPIVNWIVIGYAARVLRESPGTGVPPKLERYGELFVDGAKVFFAALIYMIIPVILIGVGIWTSFASFFMFLGETSFMFPGEAPAMVFGGIGLLLLAVGVILAIILLIVLGMGNAHMIKTGKFGKAFAFGEIFAVIRGVGWGKYLGWIILVVIIAAVVGGIAAIIPFVGWLISLIISPVLSVFIFRSLGLLYNDGAPPELRAPAIAPVAVPSPPTEAGTKFCINCGARIPATANFCGVCGTKQT